MDYKYEPKKISRNEFFNLKEENVIFITNPGRMGDEDGSTFIIKDSNNYKTYRIDGWIYGNHNEKDFISLSEILKHFPKWKKTWDNCNNKEYDGKYIYIYTGFGNGVFVDKTIFKEFEPYLVKEVEKIRLKYNKEKIEPSMYYPACKSAIENMINNK